MSHLTKLSMKLRLTTKWSSSTVFMPAGFPLHKLVLKVNVPVMLLKNLDPPLCTGIHLFCCQMLPHVLEATIIIGKNAGEAVSIPRIPLIRSGDNLPVDWKRLKFSVRLSFAMTVKNYQGQGLKVVDLKLDM